MPRLNCRGAVPVVLLIAAIALIAFLALASTVSFKNGLLAVLFPKPPSEASTVQDSDKDGWSDQIEKSIGTDISRSCANDLNDNAWPPDLNNDRSVNNIDSLLLRSALVKTYNTRYDLNFDHKLDNSDLIILNQWVGKTCQKTN